MKNEHSLWNAPIPGYEERREAIKRAHRLRAEAIRHGFLAMAGAVRRLAKRMNPSTRPAAGATQAPSAAPSRHATAGAGARTAEVV